ncbi:hypothetical protein ABT320_01755 [Streptomyces cellulosae]
MTTPTNALARRWKIDIDMSADKDGSDYQNIIGITEFTQSAEPNIEDSSDYDSEGWAGNTKTGQAWEVGLTINRRINDQVKTYHPTHEKLRFAGYAYGSDSEVRVRWYDRDGLPEAYEGVAVVQWAPSGGEATALDQVEVTLTGNGVLSLITNPVA